MTCWNQVSLVDITVSQLLSEASDDADFLNAVAAKPETANLVTKVRALENIKNLIENRPDLAF